MPKEIIDITIDFETHEGLGCFQSENLDFNDERFGRTKNT